MLEVFFTQDSKIEDLFCETEPSRSFINDLFGLVIKHIQDQHDFARMTDEADSTRRAVGFPF